MPLPYTLRACFSVIVSQTALLKLGLADLTELQTSGFGEEKKAIQQKLGGSAVTPASGNPITLQSNGRAHRC